MDTLRSSSATGGSSGTLLPQQHSTSTINAFLSPRQLVDELKKFIQMSEAPPTTHHAGGGLSDAGFILLRLKDQLLAVVDQRGLLTNFPAEFAARPYSGVELLVKVVVVLQTIVNSIGGNSSRISNLLSRSNSSTNRKRKAAVAEADCIECIKILLEKTQIAWRAILDYPGNLEVILYSINSPQLDSKCYALEIIILLLDQPSGFSLLFRSLTFIAGRSRDDLRLNLFISQLKHGLHTSKLHIQILVVRLLNRLLTQAPTLNHRVLAQIEAEIAHFTPEYVEKLVMDAPAPLVGVESLMEELRIWKTNYLPLNMLHRTTASFSQQPPASINQNPLYGYSYASEGESGAASATDTMTATRSDRQQRPMRNGKFSNQTTVAKNVERQRMKRQEAESINNGSGGGRQGVINSSTLSNPTFAFMDRDALAAYYPTTALPPTSKWDQRFGGGAYPPMRRAKSESTVFVLSGDEMRPNGGLKRMPTAPDESTIGYNYHRQQPINVDVIGGRRRGRRHPSDIGLSRSTHDLSTGHQLAPSQYRFVTGTRPGSAATIERGGATTGQNQQHRFYRPITPRGGADSSSTTTTTTTPRSSSRVVSPHFAENLATIGGAASAGQQQQTRARFAEPLVEKPTKAAVHMQGFSYLFPAQPIIDNIPMRQQPPTPSTGAPPSTGVPPSRIIRPPSAPITTSDYHSRPHSTSPSPMTTTVSVYGSGNGGGKSNNEVVYIPINIEGTNTVLRRAIGGGGGSRSATPLGAGRRRQASFDLQSSAPVDTDYSLDSRSSSVASKLQQQQRPGSVTYSTTFGDDVKDALSQFDYLNDYDGTSSRGSRYGGGGSASTSGNATYHF